MGSETLRMWAGTVVWRWDNLDASGDNSANENLGRGGQQAILSFSHLIQVFTPVQLLG